MIVVDRVESHLAPVETFWPQADYSIDLLNATSWLLIVHTTMYHMCVNPACLCACVYLCTRLLRGDRAGLASNLANIILSLFLFTYIHTTFYSQIKYIIISLALLSYNVKRYFFSFISNWYAVDSWLILLSIQMITHKKLLLLFSFLIKLLYNLYFNNKVLYTAQKICFTLM